MALTDENKFRILKNLCYPSTTLDETSTNYNSIVNDRLNGLSSYAEEEVETLLGKIEVLDGKLESSPDSFKVKQVGEIHFNVNGGSALYRKELLRKRKQLATLLDIPNRCKGGSCFTVRV
jgi:hypothetical protein